MKEGKIQWSKVQAPEEGFVQDGKGGLWVAYRQPAEGKKKATPSDELMLVRVDSKGAGEAHPIPAPPALLDQSGILWLAARGDEQEMRSGEFVLWKDGEVVGRARATGVWRTGNIASDKPGSVWVWTNLGLQHLVAEDPAKPADYKLKSTTVVVIPEGDPVNSNAVRFEVCDEGLLVKHLYTGDPHVPGERVLLVPTAGK